MVAGCHKPTMNSPAATLQLARPAAAAAAAAASGALDGFDCTLGVVVAADAHVHWPRSGRAC